MSLISLSLIIGALTGTDAFKQTGQSAPLNKPYDQEFADRYSPLKYLGGLGPYSVRSGNGISTDIPAGCEVDQVVMLQRHGERYPSPSSVKPQRAVLEKIFKSHPEPFTGDLAFLNSWEYFLKSDGDAGLEITTGPYSGLADLFEKGSTFHGRYGHLWDGESSVPLFTTGSERVIQSARSFGRGFFGYNYTDVAQVNIISEDPSAGGNAISPYFCGLEERTECKVPDPTDLDSVYDIEYPDFDVAAIRLNENHGLHLTAADVSQLFEIGSFDVSVHGDSPWLDVFTRSEWSAYNYRQGLWFYCNFGHGSKIGRSYGTNWANATTKVLNQGPEDSGLPLVLNFGHDSDITNFLGGMNILSPLKELTTDKVSFDTRWDISDITPMGAQLVIERLKCEAPGLTNSTDLRSANATVPDSFLNASYGTPEFNVSTSYFSPNYTNSTVNSTAIYPNSSVSYDNETITAPYSNTTIQVTNGTNGSVIVNNVTSVYGFNLTEGTTNNTPLESSYFVRLVLNDAVLPMDNCYNGPGYSCSLEDWTDYVAQQAKLNNFVETCKPEEEGVPAYIDYYWNYNKTTDEDVPDYIPWQGSPLV